MNIISEKPREECGVIGIISNSGSNCVGDIHRGLFALQHRGQESCGIAAFNGEELTCIKGMGLITEVFPYGPADLSGSIAIGHVRYSTTGGSTPENAQPIAVRTSFGSIAIAHNGNLVNSKSLTRELGTQGAIFHSTSDTELIALALAKEFDAAGSVEKALETAMNNLKGAYSLVIGTTSKLIAARDPVGFRPLCIGQREDGYVFASESCAIDAAGAKFIRDIKPGEIVIADKGGLRSIETHCGSEPHACIFEYIYFARPDSVIDNISIYESRIAAGRALAKQSKVEADVVIGVPESGIIAAIGYSMQSGVPYNIGFVKNSYVGRTFISPVQEKREKGVMIKLNAIRSCVEGKRIVMIDDSIVRGTTAKKIIKMLREEGAKEVHVRISSPPFAFPCYYGTDVGSFDQLAIHKRTHDELCRYIGADSLEFLSLESLAEIVNGKSGFCDACFSGRYPVLSSDNQ